MSSSVDNAGTSTRPYLLRALHEWCSDNGFTPYIAVFVDAGVRVPMEYVKNNEIVLNIGHEATSAMKLGNDCIEFKARFGGTSRHVVVPVDHVVAIYARENGQGMAFPAPIEAKSAPEGEAAQTGLRLARTETSDTTNDAGAGEPDPQPDPPAGGPRPTLKRIK